jgi:Asp-tRNA(Asn)/Glu-tRNA(Gln) amidotransferase A subunit family amidase
MSELTSLTIAEARAKLAAKEIKAVELTDAYLSAIEGANGALNAYVAVTPEIARAMAKASDARIADGKAGVLEGIPLGVKDLFAAKGVHTQACSHILDGFKPEYESTVTTNLWDAGAVMLGKLNMDEFAMGSSNESSYYGPAVNPWKPSLLISAQVRPQPTPAALSVSRQPSPAPSASSRPMAAARAGALSPSPRRSTRPVRSPATCAMQRSF